MKLKKKDSLSDCLYRYNDTDIRWGSSGWGEPKPTEYQIIKRTPQGVWIDIGWFQGKKKFVKLNAHKKFACETEEAALVSYIARKSRQIKILKGRLEQAQKFLLEAVNFKNKKALESNREHRQTAGTGAV